MTTEELIEQYQTAVDELNGLEDDDSDFDDWSIKAADVAEKLKGKRVVARVKWHNGKTTETEGAIISLEREKVYLDTHWGNVEGDAMGMAAA